MDPQDILSDGAEKYEEKNDDYGDSWRKAGEILYKMADEEPVTLDSAEDWILAGLYTRRLDKLLGAFNGEFLTDEELNFEDAGNRHGDESVYAAMHASLHADDEEDDVGVDDLEGDGHTSKVDVELKFPDNDTDEEE